MQSPDMMNGGNDYESVAFLFGPKGFSATCAKRTRGVCARSRGSRASEDTDGDVRRAADHCASIGGEGFCREVVFRFSQPCQLFAHTRSWKTEIKLKNGSSFSAFDRASRKVRILRFPSVTGSRARRAFAMPGSWRATSRSVAGGVGLERGARGAPFLGGPVGDAAFRIQPNGDACAIRRPKRARRILPNPPGAGSWPPRSGSRNCRGWMTAATRSRGALRLRSRSRCGARAGRASGRPRRRRRDSRRRRIYMRPGDEEDGAWPEESAAARKARWAADAREAAACARHCARRNRLVPVP